MKYPILNHEQFLNPNTPEVAYILGILWADGNIRDGRICIELTKVDAERILPIFLKTGDWRVHERPAKVSDCNRKARLAIHKCNTIIGNFLKENDYELKSTCSPCKILSKIPENLKKYWLRGYFDGDGCLYSQNENRIVFQISGSYEQDWKWFCYFFNSFGINVKVERKIFNHLKNHRGSQIRISNGQKVVKICNYMYDGFENDRIGFLRKYEIFDKYKCLHEKKLKRMEIELINLDTKQVIRGGTKMVKEKAGLSDTSISVLRNGIIKKVKQWMVKSYYEDLVINSTV